MHKPPRDFPFAPSPERRNRAAFSIVEIALALGIVGFAFVGLMGLLPAGLATFRAAIDQTNEGRIMESLTAQTQAAEFSNLPTQFDFQQSGAVFYFDEEGTFIRQGSAAFGGLSATEKLAALYAAKIFVDDGWNGNSTSTNAKSAMVLLVSTGSGAYAQFQNDIKTRASVQTLMAQGKLHVELRVRTMIAPKMDGQPLPK